MELPPGENLPFQDLSIKSDIWSLGLVIWELMYSSTIEREAREKWRSRFVEDYDFSCFDDPELLSGEKGRYSKALHMLKDRCLQVDPGKRPTPHDIALKCEDNLTKQLPNSVGKFSGGEIYPHLHLDYKKEQFEMHTKLTRARARAREDSTVSS